MRPTRRATRIVRGDDVSTRFRIAAASRVNLLLGLVALLPFVAGPPAFAQALRGEGRRPFGDATSTVHYSRDRSYDVKHMVLSLSFDWGRKWVGGETAITLTPLAEPLKTVRLDAAEMKITEVAAGERALTHWTSGEVLLVDLGREVKPGEEITLTIRHEAIPSRGLYFVSPDKAYPKKPRMIYSQGEEEDNHWWFPCYDYPNDRTTWEMFLTVPAGFTALGNGRLMETREIPGGAKRTFHWSQEIPASSYLVSVAIGEFEVLREEYDGIPVEYYVPKGTPREDALRSFGLTPDMMKFFSEAIGIRYPYAKYAQSAMADFIYGGMENVTATTQTLETIHPADVEKEASSVGLVAHELAHQWWGDFLTCRDWSHAWLNEGFATYFENLYKESRTGKDEFQYEMLADERSYMKEDETEYRRPIVESRYTDPFDLFDSHLYPKGGWTLHMLRGIVGDDLFWRSIYRYAGDHKAGNVITDDLRRAFEAVTGRNLEWFFNEWYHHGGHPEYRVNQTWDEKTGTVRLRVEQVQKVDALTPLFRMPVKVVFSTDAASWDFTLEISRQMEEFSFPLPEPPKMTRFDAGYHVLKTLDFQRSVEELRYQLVHDPDVPGRAWAAEQLGRKTRDESAVEALGETLAKEPFWGVRVEIVKALGKIRLPAARDALIGALKDTDTRVRAAAVDSLGRFRDDPMAAEAIRGVFRGEKNIYVRGAAARAYAAVRAPDAFSLLKEAASVVSYREVVATGAYEGMQDLGDFRAVPVLKEGARYGHNRRRREAAIKTLGDFARGDSKRDVVDFLLPLLQDPWIFARDAAIEALGKAKDERAIPALLDASGSEIDARLRRHAREAIAAIRRAGSPADLEELRKRLDQLQDSSDSLRERMIRLETEKGGSRP